ncbi:MAG: hypothetical protein LC634_09735 [Sphingomonadales bacterium]|nr:hypothetical protein [Sphingomonadales bacterium]
MAKNPVGHRRFVLFSMPRTGSNMMVSLLKSHPRIACLSAIFSKVGWTDWSEADRKAPRPHKLAALPAKWNDRDTRIAEMEAFLERLLALYGGKPAFGFKQHLGGLSDRATRRVVEQRWAAVILERSNLLAAYSSDRLVEETGEGSVMVGETPTRATVPFDAADFEEFVTRRRTNYDHWSREVAASGAPYMTIDYCDARAPGGLDPVAEFLGLETGQFGDPSTRKRNPDDILSRFSNPDEARAWLEANGRIDWAVEE